MYCWIKGEHAPLSMHPALEITRQICKPADRSKDLSFINRLRERPGYQYGYVCSDVPVYNPAPFAVGA